MATIASGLIGGLLVTLFLRWAIDHARRVSPDREGWTTLRPGLAIWVAILGSAAFSLLLFYVYFFVGSARADAEKQMMYCLALALAFALASFTTAGLTFFETVSWRDREVRIDRLFSAPVRKDVTDLQKIEFRAWSGLFQLTFDDGYVVKLSPYMDGTRQLLDYVVHQTDDAFPPASQMNEGKVLRRIDSEDGTRYAELVRHGRFYVFEEYAEERDGEDVYMAPSHCSGLYATLAEAERDMIATLSWLREGRVR